jgi:hypothetical protein
MEGSRSLFNGAEAMRIERGAPGARPWSDEGISSALLNAAERELPTERDFQGLEPNSSSLHAGGDTHGRGAK